MTNSSQTETATILTHALIESPSPEVIRALAETATRLEPAAIAEGILTALQTVTDQTCRDEVCAVWLDTRHVGLGDLIHRLGWVAGQPPPARFLTALKAERPEIIEHGGAELIDPLLRACADSDPTVAAQAHRLLRHLPNVEAQAELHRRVIDTEDPLVLEIARAAAYAPPDAQQRALVYLLTEQWEAYESLDFDNSLLRTGYQLGNEWLQQRIANLARRAGRADLIGVIAGERHQRRLSEMTDHEWTVVLSLLEQDEAWDGMWQLAQVAPAMWGAQFLQRLGQAGWQPQPSAMVSAAAFKALLDAARKCNPAGLYLDRAATCQATLTGHTEPVFDLAISPDGQLLASGGGDHSLRLWNLPQGKALRTLEGHSDQIWGVAISPDGQLLVSSSDDRTVRLWRLPDGKALQTLGGQTDVTNAVVISPVSLKPGTAEWLLATGGVDQTIQLWSLPGGKLLRTLTGHTDAIMALAVSPDGKLLASAGRDQTVRLWQLPDAIPLQTLSGHTGSVNCLAFNPSGQLLASGSLDQTIRLWRLPDGQPLKTLKGHTGSVVGVALNPADGLLLASTGLDQTVRLWQLPGGVPLTQLTGHTDWVSCLALSPNGQLLASGSDDHTIRLWGSDLMRLCRTPVAQTTLDDMTWVEESLQDEKLPPLQKVWFEFLLDMMRWHRRFDIDIEEAPQQLSIGMFDIEIEG